MTERVKSQATANVWSLELCLLRFLRYQVTWSQQKKKKSMPFPEGCIFSIHGLWLSRTTLSLSKPELTPYCLLGSMVRHYVATHTAPGTRLRFMLEVWCITGSLCLSSQSHASKAYGGGEWRGRRENLHPSYYSRKQSSADRADQTYQPVKCLRFDVSFDASSHHAFVLHFTCTLSSPYNTYPQSSCLC